MKGNLQYWKLIRDRTWSNAEFKILLHQVCPQAFIGSPISHVLRRSKCGLFLSFVSLNAEFTDTPKAQWQP